MKWVWSITFLITSASSLAVDQATSDDDGKAQSIEVAATKRSNETDLPLDSTSLRTKARIVPNQDREESNPVAQTDNAHQDATDVPEATHTAAAFETPISLDELLRQVRQTPHLQHEAMLARLAERRRLAIAIRSTLEAAEQVADFGLAGTQLLNDASLDQVVSTMIARQEGERHAEKKPNDDLGPTLAPERPSPGVGTPSSADEEDQSGFEDWQPVYIVTDSRGHRIGWRNLSNAERAITYVGEQWHIGADTVFIVAVASDGSRRHLKIDLNGERREIHLF